ncbi:MAG: hypothetical protein M1582_01305 [Actinobacteria bacterium]|nr:hypothetical protein [Actinomycetota bacterium]
MTLNGSSDNAKVPATKYAWTLTAPTASKATLSAADKSTVKFTPDVSGIYKVDLAVSNDAGAGKVASIQIHAGE